MQFEQQQQQQQPPKNNKNNKTNYATKQDAMPLQVEYKNL